MGTAVDDVGRDPFLVLLSEAAKGPRPKAEALDAMSLRPVWLATWEPEAEGFRTLINAAGEEALAVFSSEKALEAAAARFDWLAPDGTISTHRAIGGDILRHAWTREYAFVVVDIGTDHELEYDREELKRILRELDSTGPFRTSRPPAPPAPPTASSSFPPPVEKASTVYSMGPSKGERVERLSELPTKPHEALPDSEPPTQPRAAVSQAAAAPTKRASSGATKKPKSDRPAAKIEEVRVSTAEPDSAGTYGAASIVPPSKRAQKPMLPQLPEVDESLLEDSREPESSSAPRLNSEAPTAPAAFGLGSMQPGKLKLPPLEPINSPQAAPRATPEAQPGADATKGQAKTPVQPTHKPPRAAAPSIGDGIKLVPLQDEPDENLLASLGQVLRGYFEVEWASYCQVARPAGAPSPAVALRITDDYRDNVTAIIKALCEAGRSHGTEIDVLLIDGHDMLRKARENAFVFYPWKPKPLHG